MNIAYEESPKKVPEETIKRVIEIIKKNRDHYKDLVKKNHLGELFDCLRENCESKGLKLDWNRIFERRDLQHSIEEILKVWAQTPENQTLGWCLIIWRIQENYATPRDQSFTSILKGRSQEVIKKYGTDGIWVVFTILANDRIDMFKDYDLVDDATIEKVIQLIRKNRSHVQELISKKKWGELFDCLNNETRDCHLNWLRIFERRELIVQFQEVLTIWSTCQEGTSVDWLKIVTEVEQGKHPKPEPKHPKPEPEHPKPEPGHPKPEPEITKPEPYHGGVYFHKE